MVSEAVQRENDRLRALKPLKAADQKFVPLPSQTHGFKTAMQDLTGKSICLNVFCAGTLRCRGDIFVEGLDKEIEMSDYAFLIEHGREKLFFDLGLRKDADWPESAAGFTKRYGTHCESTPAQLIEKFPNCTLRSVKTIIFSHLHPDHVGNLAEYPRDAAIVLGPQKKLSRAELAKKLLVDESVLGDRKVRYLSKEDFTTKIGCFNGYDYFGDGTMFLLDTPGHMEGSISALIRTDVNVWHLLAGDAAHHVSQIDAQNPTGVALFPAKDNPASDQSEPEALKSMEDDLETSYKTMAGLARMDQEPNVNVWLSHDSTLGAPLLSADCEKIGGDHDELAGFKARNRHGKTSDRL